METFSQDLENLIQVNNLQLGSAELRVQVVNKSKDGFTETKIERLKLQKPTEVPTVCVARPFYRAKEVADTISLAVVDVKSATALDDNCWQVFNCPFRKVLVYGKVDVLNLFTRCEKTCYKMLVDDGTENILATMNLTREAKVQLSAQQGKLTLARNKLNHRKEIGFNIKGNVMPAKSAEAEELVKNIAILHLSVSKTLQKQQDNKRLQQGPQKEKALIMGFLYMTKGGVQMSVIDINFDDKKELVWKQQLNKIYTKDYLKRDD